MQIYFFRAGRREIVHTSAQDNAKTIAWAKQVLAGATRATTVVQTQLVISVNGRKISHTLACRERQEPNTLFLAVVTESRLNTLRSAAAFKRRLYEASLRRQIEDLCAHTTSLVRWDELTARQQARLQGRELSPEQCWLWQPLAHLRSPRVDAIGRDEAPYRAFYQQLKGRVPASVLLRHSCHNRLCMNPNHLQLGTPQDNVDDMMASGRHHRQVQARLREKRRAAYRLRKAK